ncbi:unnamed protein product [Timema podura]|uniref:THAP-type domain-containing protein n=1 Tax=Timema podura TaxID=61482 RepID=A0ABN7NUR1_TIMPD|nr:unnamed protein product [Timema podura]
MPTSCCVPGCKSNYNSKPPRVSAFQFPNDKLLKLKWLSAIHRADFVPRKRSVVCIKHFDERFVVREDSVKRPDGSILTLKRDHLKLTKDAFPTYFVNLSKELPTLRKKPAIKQDKFEKRLERKHAQDKEDWLKDFDDLKCNLVYFLKQVCELHFQDDHFQHEICAYKEMTDLTPAIDWCADDEIGGSIPNQALSSGPSSVPENEVESEPDENEKWIHTIGAEVPSPKMEERQLKNCCANHSNQANQSMIPQKQDDKLDALALAVSKKLRKMDCHQQTYAENVINRALFFGSMGLLTAFSDGHPTSSHNTGSTSSLPPEKQRKLVTRKHPKTPPGPKNAPEELLELTFIKEEPSTSDNEVAHYEPTFVDVSAPSTIEDGPFIKSEPPETITAESPDETFSKYSEPTCTQSPQEVQLCMTSKNNSASNTSLRPSESALEPPPLVLLSKSSPQASISGKSTEQRNLKKKRSLQEANDGNETLPIFQTDVPEAEVRVRVAELQVEQMKKEYEAKMKNQQIIAEQFKKEHEAKMKEHEAKMKEHELKMKKVKGQIVEMEFRCQEMMKQSVIENKVHELTVMDLEQKLSTSQIIHELTIQELKQKLYNSQLEQQILEKRLNAHPS